MSKGKKTRNNPLLPGFEDFNVPVLGDDPSLEAELLELIGGGMNKPSKPTNKKMNLKPVAIDTNLLNLDLNDDVEDGDLDEDDPELLAELNSFLNEETVEHNQKIEPKGSSSESIKKLENLKSLYQEAIKQSEDQNDVRKSRMYDRALKQINELLQKALRGFPVDESEFPPEIRISSKPLIKITENPKILMEKQVIEPPNKSARIQPHKDENQTTVQTSNKVLDSLIQRQMEYKHAAIEAKSKNTSLAKGLMVVFKQFDEVINAVKSGEPFDLEDMPPHPSEFKLSDLEGSEEPSVASEPEVPVVKSLAEELKSRLSYFMDCIAKAKSEGNDSKSRRMGRVVQQYEEALNAFKKNLPFSYEELPPPPGKQALSNPSAPGPKMQYPNSQKTAPSQIANKSSQPVLKTVSKNTKLLQERQVQFRAAALKAKQNGEHEYAKELLRQSMGFNQMIEASESGLPIDMSKLPSLPTETDYNFEVISAEECEIPPDMQSVSKETLLKQLQVTLLEQIKTCKKYQNTVTKAGDIISAKRFESMVVSCEKDLNGLKCLIQKNAEIPKFHYEYKIFSILQSNPDLAETEMTVEITKGTDFAVPSGYSADQFDTYIVLELPFPNDAFQTFTTDTVRKTNNPVYNSSHKFQVNLKSRVFQRVCKSKQIKADIYYKKGFLQKDKLYGSSNIKLEKLETLCSIHDSLDIFENRKLVAGKLEVKIRIRNPLLSNQSENIKEKWLVIDEFNMKSNISNEFQPVSANALNSSLKGGSIDVLKFEIVDMKRTLTAKGSVMTPALANSVKQKIHEKELALRKQEEKLNSPDPSVRLSYLQSISNLPQEYNNEAKKYLSENKRDKAQMSITKKKLVDNEIDQLKNSRLKTQ